MYEDGVNDSLYFFFVRSVSLSVCHSTGTDGTRTGPTELVRPHGDPSRTASGPETVAGPPTPTAGRDTTSWGWCVSEDSRVTEPRFGENSPAKKFTEVLASPPVNTNR